MTNKENQWVPVEFTQEESRRYWGSAFCDITHFRRDQTEISSLLGEAEQLGSLGQRLDVSACIDLAREKGSEATRPC